MKTAYLANIASVVYVVLSCLCVAVGQDGPTSRSVTSNDFAAQRPQRPRTGRTSPKVTPRTYKHTRTDKNIARWKTPKKPLPPPPANSPVKVTEIGVTMWK